jgi:hypothetical protein
VRTPLFIGGVEHIDTSEANGGLKREYASLGSNFIQRATSALGAGLPDLSWHNIPKREKIFQIAIK